MDRPRTTRPTLHAPALIGLFALPLVLTASQVEAQLAASDAAATRAVQEVAPDRTDRSYPTTTPPAVTAPPAVAAQEYEVPSRPGLGEAGAGEIPWVALQAYRRAADILGEVDPSCGISWAMLAAVGQVESEHGRSAGGELGDDGVVQPAIVTRGADAAVGPMQLLPDAWKMAGVDGDGDGTRSPQDLDDAAVAAGVYLCATGSDLRSPEGAEKALLAYNSSPRYVDQVLAVASRYRNGDYAVAEPPQPQTIGVMLDYGLGSPADDRPEADGRRRSQNRAEQQAEDREYTARLSAVQGAAREPARQDDARRELLPAAPAAPATGAPAAGEPAGTAASLPTGEPTPQPTDAATEEPSASPTASPTATPSETPSATPTATPSETPSGSSTETTTEAVAVERTGVWTACGESYCLDEVPLDLTGAGVPTEPAAADLDGDGTVETLAAELEGLVGQTVVLTVEEGTDPVVVTAVGDHPMPSV